ncbi:MAG TPA: FtsX-like permease family protein [Woeseiaceae bacterium]|nr:FtsX-like permease family protein [Woeseiaceae bacterium]
MVGLAGDVRQRGVETAPQPGIFLPYPQFPEFPFANIIVRTPNDDMSTVRQVVARIHEIDPNLAVADIASMREVVADAVARPRLTSFLVSCFAGLALLLAAVGIYGVVSYTVTLRVREMGVRRALGAQTGDLARLVLADALRLGTIGVGIGLIAAALATRALRSLLYEVSPRDPFTFAGTAGFLLLVALIAAAMPALRAARINPSRVIREQ